jgi:mono/diheme cytochrome c family protein
LSKIRSVVAIAVLASGLAACRQDMHDQPTVSPLEESDFFDDRRSVRLPMPGTIARGQLRADTLLETGTANGTVATMFPFPIDVTVMRRGRQRYDIFCAPCHARTGNADGMIVRRGYRRPPSLHIDRLREAPAGHFFDVITNGFGAMPSYADQITPRDRWATVAYLRALQLSQHATVADVPAALRKSLETSQ